MFKILGSMLLILALSACASTPSEQHSAMCKQLRNKIVMNGATTNPLKAQTQRAEMGKIDSDYRDQGCN